MNIEHCIQEDALSTAAHNRCLTPEQLLHARSCPACETVVIATAAMTSQAEQLGDLRPPEASVIWRRAQQQAKKQALTRATLPIRIALACTCIVGVISTPWIISAVLRLVPELTSVKWMPTLDHNWTAALSGTTAIGITATVICIALSSWFVLREQ